MFRPVFDSLVRRGVQGCDRAPQPFVEPLIIRKKIQVRCLHGAGADRPIINVQRVGLFEVGAELVFEKLHQHGVMQAVLRTLLAGQQRALLGEKRFWCENVKNEIVCLDLAHIADGVAHREPQTFLEKIHFQALERNRVRLRLERRLKQIFRLGHGQPHEIHVLAQPGLLLLRRASWRGKIPVVRPLERLAIKPACATADQHPVRKEVGESGRQQFQRCAHLFPIVDFWQRHTQAMCIMRRVRRGLSMMTSANSPVIWRNSSGV